MWGQKPLKGMTPGLQRFRRQLLVGAGIFGLLVITPAYVWSYDIARGASESERGQVYLLFGLLIAITLALLVQVTWNVLKLRRRE